MFWPCETRTSTCRSFATISSGLYRFLAIAVLLDVKDIPQVGPLQWGRIITIFDNGTEFGLNLNYSASAPNPGDRADISWTYNITSTLPISDALAALAGSATGTGTISLSESFIPNVGNIQIGPNQIGGSEIISLSPQLTSLSILKDQADHANTGSAQTSIMTNAFSVVPGPVVGAGLPGLVAACGGLIGLARRRRHQIA